MSVIYSFLSFSDKASHEAWHDLISEASS